MSDQELKQIFGRIGSKTRLKKKIYKKFPTDFDTYVEPFVGGGSVMWGYKFKPHQKIVINDLDKELIKQYRILKKGVSGDIEKYNTTNMETLTRIRDGSGDGDLGSLVRYMINQNNTFGSQGSGKIYKNTNPVKKLRDLPLYKEKLKNAAIYSVSYEKIIDKYDKPNTFFYLDPPYEKSDKQKLYKYGEMDFEKLAERLKTIKGKFLLSINDSAKIRKLFRGMKINGIELKGFNDEVVGGNIGLANRKELLISNY